MGSSVSAPSSSRANVRNSNRFRRVRAPPGPNSALRSSSFSLFRRASRRSVARTSKRRSASRISSRSAARTRRCVSVIQSPETSRKARSCSPSTSKWEPCRRYASAAGEFAGCTRFSSPIPSVFHSAVCAMRSSRTSARNVSINSVCSAESLDRRLAPASQVNSGARRCRPASACPRRSKRKSSTRTAASPYAPQGLSPALSWESLPAEAGGANRPGGARKAAGHRRPPRQDGRPRCGASAPLPARPGAGQHQRRPA